MPIRHEESSFVTQIKRYLQTLELGTANHATAEFRNVRGRSDFAPKLAAWLQNSQAAFSEGIRAEDTDHMTDRGVDVDLRGITSFARIGFQIKSENDLKSGLLDEIKRQFVDAQVGGNLRLFVIVFACSSEGFRKYKQVLNDSLRLFSDWLVLSPERAVSLWEAMKQPLAAEDLTKSFATRNWDSFFEIVCPARRGEFMDRWPNLTPEERFVLPSESGTIQRSIKSHPLTVLVGPPTVGKTFFAVLHLYAHFMAGKQVRWIEGGVAGISSSPFPHGGQTRGMTEHVRNLAPDLGFTPKSIPKTPFEFIAANLEPDSLVLLEDPFGAEEADFETSLSQYRFLDLQVIVDALSSAHLRGCSIILTTRQGLFEKWVAELNRADVPIPKLSIIGLSQRSYELDFLRKGDVSLTRKGLAERLFRSRCGESPEFDIEDASSHLSNAGTPAEIERLVLELPAHVTPEDVNQVVKRIGSDYLNQTRILCRANNDDERLFLLLLTALTQGGHRGNLQLCFEKLASIIRIEGRSVDELRHLYWRIVCTSFNDDNSIRDVSPTHASVRTAIWDEIQDSKEFLGKVISSLRELSMDLLVNNEWRLLVRFFTRHHKTLSDAGCADVLNQVPGASGHGQSYDCIDQVIREWSSLPRVAQKAFLGAYASLDQDQVLKTCVSLGYYPRFPKNSAWQIYSGILEELPRSNRLLDGSPYRYLVYHSKQLPPELITRLENGLKNNSRRFLSALGSDCFEMWERIPETWKLALTKENALGSPMMARHSLISAFYHRKVPNELLSIVRGFLKSPNLALRQVACELLWVSARKNYISDSDRKLLLESLDSHDAAFSIRVFTEVGDTDDFTLNYLRRISSRLDEHETTILVCKSLQKHEISQSMWQIIDGIIPHAYSIAYAMLRLGCLEGTLSGSSLEARDIERRCNHSQLLSITLWHATLKSIKGQSQLNSSTYIQALKGLKGASLDAVVYVVEHQSRFLEPNFVEAIRASGVYLEENVKEVSELARANADESHQEGRREIPSYPWEWHIADDRPAPTNAYFEIRISPDI